jgi:ribosome recycling factor
MIKTIKQNTENYRIFIRNVRRDALTAVNPSFAIDDYRKLETITKSTHDKLMMRLKRTRKKLKIVELK